MRCWCGVILRHWRTNPRRAPTPNECGVSFGSDPDFLGRSRCGFARWHNPQHEGRNLFPGFERFGNLVADRVLTGFKLWRKAAIAMASSAVSVARATEAYSAPGCARPAVHQPVSPPRSALGPTTDAGLFVGCDDWA